MVIVDSQLARNMNEFIRILLKITEFYYEDVEDVIKSGNNILDFLKIPFEENNNILLTKTEEISIINLIEKIKYIQNELIKVKNSLSEEKFTISRRRE